MKNSQLFTKREEDVLREMLELHVSLICHALPDNVQLENEPISDRLRKKARNIVNRQKHAYYHLINTGFKRAACIIVTLFTLASVVTVNVEAVKDVVFGLILTVYQECTSIFYETDKDALSYIETYYEPDYITEGFTETWRKKDTLGLIITYKDVNGNVLYYSQGIKKGTGSWINTENGYSEKIVLNDGREAMYYTSGDSNGVIYTTKDYVFDFTGDVSKEEIIKLMESLKIE